jgi:putative endonuclease
VDLVLRKQAMLVFVEVKRARSFAVAAERVTQRQLARIIATASEFVATEPAGQDSEMRFDAALVDEIGRIEIRENILAW